MEIIDTRPIIWLTQKERDANRKRIVSSKRGHLSKNLATKLYFSQRGKCVCCALPLGNFYHMDHIMPLALGGLDIDSNIQLMRSECNRRKGSLHPDDYAARERENKNNHPATSAAANLLPSNFSLPWQRKTASTARSDIVASLINFN